MSNPLAGYEEILPEEMFYRVHRSYLVNCRHIVKVTNDESHHVLMKGDHTIPISRRRYTSLMEFLANNDYP
jgi:two-component system LytT family response regulator